MSQQWTLKDGSEVVIRPMDMDDLEASYAFFKALPEEDRQFLRADVTDRRVVSRRIDAIGTGRVRRIVACVGSEIVADGVLEFEGHEWKDHVAELRLFVARPYQRKGLGVLMAKELYALAASDRVEEIVVKMMRPQKAAHSIFKRLGFHDEIILPGYVKDISGQKQDLLVMRCDLEGFWKKLEHYYVESDWQRTR